MKSSQGKVEFFLSFIKNVRRFFLPSFCFFLAVSQVLYSTITTSAENGENTIVEEGVVFIEDDSSWDDYYIGGEGSLSTSDRIIGENSMKITTVERGNYNG
ncbi:MAG: hypothetical protein PHI66_04435, partial [Candidatus Pacebacteria bacterium]|nr:hypothetical protein [Candidatus Paceibacterota bacterium]